MGRGLAEDAADFSQELFRLVEWDQVLHSRIYVLLQNLTLLFKLLGPR